MKEIRPKNIILGSERFKIDNRLKNKPHKPKTPPGTPPPLVNHSSKQVRKGDQMSKKNKCFKK